MKNIEYKIKGQVSKQVISTAQKEISTEVWGQVRRQVSFQVMDSIWIKIKDQLMAHTAELVNE